jgi:hypothetical protein
MSRPSILLDLGVWRTGAKGVGKARYHKWQVVTTFHLIEDREALVRRANAWRTQTTSSSSSETLTRSH